LTVATSQAAITELIERCDIHEIVPIVYPETPSITRSLPDGRVVTVNFEGDKIAFTSKMRFVEGFNSPGDYWEYEVKFELTPKAEIGLRVEWLEVQYLMIKLIFDVKVTGAFNIATEKKSRTISTTRRSLNSYHG
jgi:hypothetical protein